MGKMKSYRDQTRTGLIMSEVDLRELYCYLELFHKTYISNEEKVLDVMKTIRELYSLQEGIKEEDIVFRSLGIQGMLAVRLRSQMRKEKKLKLFQRPDIRCGALPKRRGYQKAVSRGSLDDPCTGFN